jgi:hypothetical protein
LIFKQFYIKELVLIASSDADASEKAMAKLVEIVGLVNESDLNFSTITALTVIASHGNEAVRAQALINLETLIGTFESIVCNSDFPDDFRGSAIDALTVIASHGNEADRAQALTIFEANGFVHEIFRPRSRITNIQAFLKRVSSSTIGAA